MTAGELAVALVGSCKNLAGKLKSTESERAALLQSVDMHRSENRRLLEVPSLPHYHTFIQLTKTFPALFRVQESTLLKDTLREAQGGDMGAIARAMSRLNKSQQPGTKEARLVWGVRWCCVWCVFCVVYVTLFCVHDCVDFDR